MANAAVYLPTPVSEIVPRLSDKNLNRGAGLAPAFFEWEVAGKSARLNVMAEETVAGHLTDFINYVKRSPEKEDEKAQALSLIADTRTVLGLVTDIEFLDEPKLWCDLIAFAKTNRGFVFAHDSIFIPDGSVILGSVHDHS